MDKSHPVPLWQRSLIVLSGTVVGFAIFLGLQWGRPVFIPIALAILLTFLLNPVVRLLQQRGLGRIPSVMATVVTSGIILVCLIWVVTRQVTGMLAELPQSTANIRAKVKTLRQLGSGPLKDQFEQMLAEVTQELQSTSETDLPADATDPTAPALPATEHPDSSSARSTSIPLLGLTFYLGSALELLATLAFSLVLLVFFLLAREDLRDRIVLLAGDSRLALTSSALEDITSRVSNYIVMVAMLNGGFGVLLSAGLFALQVPYALLWGFFAAGLRFIPYIGPWIGAIFPIAMSLATSAGWWQPLSVLGFVMLLELTSNNIVEPLVFRHSTGVSPTALLISAAFWLYLWGPVGLVLSAPFAVCLVVLGKNIPQMSFLNILLGDAPALRADVGLYQRLMLGNHEDALSLVLRRIKETGPEAVYDGILIPALNYAKRDTLRGDLTDDGMQTVLQGTRACLCSTAKTAATHSAEQEHAESDTRQPLLILGCPATDDADLAGLEMLRQLLNPRHWELELSANETLSSELVTRIVDTPPAIVCIAALPPSGMAHARYLCKRLREVSPDIEIIVGRWGQRRNLKIERERLIQAGATFVTTSLLETRQLLQSRAPLLMRQPDCDVAHLV